jgi:hypothetical protein
MELMFAWSSQKEYWNSLETAREKGLWCYFARILLCVFDYITTMCMEVCSGGKNNLDQDT